MKLTSKQELIDYIAQCKQSHQPIMLVSAFPRTQQIEVQSFKSTDHFIIGSSIYGHGESDEHLYVNDEAVKSLKDRHLVEPQDYNDNWWFTTKEEAEAYIVTNPEKVKKMLLDNLSEGQYNHIIFAVDNMLQAQGQKINAIKFIRGLAKCGLKEAKDFVEYQDNIRYYR